MSIYLKIALFILGVGLGIWALRSYRKHKDQGIQAFRKLEAELTRSGLQKLKNRVMKSLWGNPKKDKKKS